MSKRRRHRNHHRVRKFLAGFFYLLILVAVVAALLYVVRDNRQKKADRIAYKEALANTEGDVQETLSVKTGAEDFTDSEEEEEDALTPTPTEVAEAAESEVAPEETPEVTEPGVSPTVTPEVTGAEVSPTEIPNVPDDEKKASIMVLNGTHVSGVAAFWRTQLQTAGYSDLSMANYTGTVSTETVIYGDQTKASGLKEMFPNATFRTGTVTTGIQNANARVYDYYIVIGTADARNK